MTSYKKNEKLQKLSKIAEFFHNWLPQKVAIKLLEVALLLLWLDQPREGSEHVERSYWLWKWAKMGQKQPKTAKTAEIFTISQCWDTLHLKKIHILHMSTHIYV